MISGRIPVYILMTILVGLYVYWVGWIGFWVIIAYVAGYQNHRVKTKTKTGDKTGKEAADG